MKRFLILMVVVATLLATGCIGEIKTYEDAGRTINISIGQEFVIALGSNPTSGYGWQESYDGTMLELVEKKYEAEAEEGMVGAGGIEYFRFRAIKIGQTEITLDYERPFEEGVLEHKVFTTNID